MTNDDAPAADGGSTVQTLPAKVDRVFRVLRQVVGASLLGGVLAGAIAGSGGTVALGALAIGAEEIGLLVGLGVGIAGLFLIKQ